MAAETYKLMEEKRIYQLPRIVSQEQIQSSDVLSHLATVHDLMLEQEEFFRIQAKFQTTYTVDVFASWFSAKIDRFYSREWDHWAMGTNSLIHPWKGETVYAFPPRNLILRTVMKVREERCQVIIVTPKTAAKPWTKLLQRIASKSTTIPPSKILDIYGNPMDGSPWKAWLIHLE